MHTTIKFVVAAACALALALGGCQTMGTPNAERTVDVSKKAGGLAVVSVTVSGYTPGTHWYQIVDLRNSQQPPVSIATNAESFGLDWTASQGSEKTIVGRLAVVELAPGDYEIRRWVMRAGNGAMYASRRPFGYRFTIAAGEVVYLGNVHTDIQQSASASALPYASSVSDKQARDLPLLQQKYPAIRAGTIKIAVSPEGESRDSGARSMDGLRDLLPQ